MEEVFVEHIVKRKTTASSLFIRILFIVLVALCFLSFPLIGMFSLTLAALMIYFTYLVWGYTSVEYEYSFLNGELSVDKIMGQRKRKHIANFDIKDAEIVARADSEEIIRRARGEMRIQDFSSGIMGSSTYAMIINNAQGATEVIFEPSDNMIEAIRFAKPRIVKIADKE